MNWRPKNLNKCYCNNGDAVRQAIGDEDKLIQMAIEDARYHSYEAGIDATHQADLKWLEDKFKFVLDMEMKNLEGLEDWAWQNVADSKLGQGFLVFVSEEDWQAFKGGG